MLEICAAEHWTADEFRERWQREAKSRVPRAEGVIACSPTRALQAPVSIDRDRHGVPHIHAESSRDLSFGFGYALAQDRLFQLDYLRRKGLGRLSEILGPEGLTLDTIARTVGLNRIASEELARVTPETLEHIERFSAGINAMIEDFGDRLPLEFDLLDYRPEPWAPVDCLAIENEFRWYLTGRLPVIVMPELAKRELGDGPLLREFLRGEEDAEAVVPPEAYFDSKRQWPGEPWTNVDDPRVEPVGEVMGDSDGTGSNNWVIAGRHCRWGVPMVASDPHIAFEAVSCWYEAHLASGDYHCAGMAYVGIPAIMFGRNENVAWGITNNICSLRDLYQEQTADDHPDCFLHDGSWEPCRRVQESIAVRGAATVTKSIRFSRNGPVVNEILPPPANEDGSPVTLKWLGASHGGWLESLLGMGRARTVTEFRESLRPWHVPTFNLVVADVDGNIGVHCAGRIPLRRSFERGYRPGWDRRHQWTGLLPFEAMPHAVNPDRGWLVSANNRLAADDYPFPLFGTWATGQRAKRIREMIESVLDRLDPSARQFGWTDFRDMQQDALSLRGRVGAPALTALLSGDDRSTARPNGAIAERATEFLRKWDGRVEVDSVGATIFNIFFTRWCRAVTDVRFRGPSAELLSKQAEGFASRLLIADPFGWFPPGNRVNCVQRVFQETIEQLVGQLGRDVSQWTWGRIHRMPLRHVLSQRGDLGRLLDHGNQPVKGDMVTVCNTGCDPNGLGVSGAGYRLIADLATQELLAVDAQSASGNPGSVHYADQWSDWANGKYHRIPLNRDDVRQIAINHLELLPEAAESA